MNFTDQYIKMCDCEEVQKGAPPKGVTGVLELVRWSPLYRPNQDQVQSWIKSYVNCAYRLLQDFYYWCAVQRKEHIERVKGASMEELWLMFYMWREHYKVWENGEWVQLKEKIIETEKK